MLNNIDSRSLLIGFMAAGLVGFVLGRVRLMKQSYKAYTGRKALVDVGRSPQEAGTACLMTVVKSIVYVGVALAFAYVLLRYFL